MLLYDHILIFICISHNCPHLIQPHINRNTVISYAISVFLFDALCSVLLVKHVYNFLSQPMGSLLASCLLVMISYEASFQMRTTSDSLFSKFFFSSEIHWWDNSLRPNDGYMHQLTNHQWFRKWLVAWPVPSHSLIQCWSIFTLTLRNKL